MSRQHIYRLLDRYYQGGLEAVILDLDDRPATPALCPARRLARTPGPAGPARAVDLDHPAHSGPPRPQPRKRPKSSYRRFAADQPNECWQPDFTHSTLAYGSDTETLNWLDDHSRYLLACTATPTKLLAQPKQKPRPMAGESATDDRLMCHP
jgi:transposase InsO family protein